MENKDVAKILRETARLLEIDGAIIGRYRSYEKVAELLYSIHERIEDLAKDPKKLQELPGVGKSMAEHIREILDTGDYSLRKQLLEKIPHVPAGPFAAAIARSQESGVSLKGHFKAGTVAEVEEARARRQAARSSRIRREKRTNLS